MKVYTDIFTKDELVSDSYKQVSPFDNAELDEVAFEVLSSRVTKGGEDYGISNNDEEGDITTSAEATETVIDIVDAFKYQSCPMTKKDFGAYIKGYMARVKTHLEEKKPDRVDAFVKGATTLVKQILSQFDDFEFYMTDAMDVEAFLIPAYYKEGDLAPRFLYLKDGIDEVKC